MSENESATLPSRHGSVAPNGTALGTVRICDFTGQLAGAGATKWLAAFGADVIRIEDPVNQEYISGPFNSGFLLSLIDTSCKDIRERLSTCLVYSKATREGDRVVYILNFRLIFAENTLCGGTLFFMKSTVSSQGHILSPAQWEFSL